eukprot:SAG11_NODE_2130_length_3778_cov_2.150584_3_plen_148_part_00
MTPPHTPPQTHMPTRLNWYFDSYSNSLPLCLHDSRHARRWLHLAQTVTEQISRSQSSRCSTSLATQMLLTVSYFLPSSSATPPHKFLAAGSPHASVASTFSPLLVRTICLRSRCAHAGGIRWSPRACDQVPPQFSLSYLCVRNWLCK